MSKKKSPEQVKNVLNKNNNPTTVQETIDEINNNQKRNTNQVRALMDNLVNLPDGGTSFNSIAIQISNPADSQAILSAVSEDNYALYKKALERKNVGALEFLTKIIFETGGKKAIDDLSNSIISDYFINPESEADESLLEQVAGLFLPTVEAQCDMSFDLSSKIEGIRRETKLDDQQKQNAVGKIFKCFPKKYTENVEPCGATLDPHAQRLKQEQLQL